MAAMARAGWITGVIGALLGASQAFATDTVPLRDRLATPPVRSCAAHGPGFVAIPGSDACIRIGGRVRADVGSRVGGTPSARAPSARAPVAAETSSVGVTGRIAVDARTETDYGPARAFVRFGTGQR